jgi:hypothetical protein
VACRDGSVGRIIVAGASLALSLAGHLVLVFCLSEVCVVNPLSLYLCSRFRCRSLCFALRRTVDFSFWLRLPLFAVRTVGDVVRAFCPSLRYIFWPARATGACDGAAPFSRLYSSGNGEMVAGRTGRALVLVRVERRAHV